MTTTSASTTRALVNKVPEITVFFSAAAMLLALLAAGLSLLWFNRLL